MRVLSIFNKIMLVFQQETCDIIIFMKRVLCFLSAVLSVVGVINLSSLSGYAFAADDGCVNDRYFLALKPWDAGLDHDDNCNVIFNPLNPNDEESTKFVWKIILNIVYDLFVAVGTIAVGFIIYAGYAFLTSGGDPSKAAKARKSLVSSIAGILIALSSSILVNTISEFIVPSSDAADVLTGALNLAFSVCGVIATAFIVYGGFQYISSTGNPGKAQKARQVLIYAIIGLLVVLLASLITNFVVGAIE